jgi:hypothetical protein
MSHTYGQLVRLDCKPKTWAIFKHFTIMLRLFVLQSKVGRIDSNNEDYTDVAYDGGVYARMVSWCIL